MPEHRYLIALGSNVRHRRHGAPSEVLRAALAHFAARGLTLVAASAIVATAPLGPSRRRYANSAAIVETPLDPPRMLALLHFIEAEFGRRRAGIAWRARVLDLDIILWSGGAFAADDLVVPHPHFRQRAFVLQPASQIAARWRDPLTGLTLAHLTARLTRPLDPAAARP